jgi:hypothetical protein
VEPGFKVRHETLFELLEGGLVLGRECERFFRVTAPQEEIRGFLNVKYQKNGQWSNQALEVGRRSLARCLDYPH